MASKWNHRDEGTISKLKGKGRTKGNKPNPFHIIFIDESHRYRYEALAERKIVNTQYLDDNALDILGLKEDVYWMIDRVNWVEFMWIKSPTYIPVTLEFLN